VPRGQPLGEAAGVLRRHERQHVRRDDPARALPTTVKNTFRSYATATTVFGRDRTARNSRYVSSSATPNRTTRPPAVSRDRTSRKSLHADTQEPPQYPIHQHNMPRITKDHLHI
jgi:hypothetical protein